MQKLNRHISNGNIEFYSNGLLDGTFPDKYPDRPMYLEAVFYDVNKKVENLYIYKEVLKTHDTIQTTQMVAKVDGYKYAFQGQERDDEIKGAGNSYNYTFRMHDSRLGRFFAVDPLSAKYPYNSSYAFSENRVIDGVELEGLEFSGLNPLNHVNEQLTGFFGNNFGKNMANSVKNSAKESYHVVKIYVIDHLEDIGEIVTVTGYAMYCFPATAPFAPKVVKAGEGISLFATGIEVYDKYKSGDYTNAGVKIGITIAFQGTGFAIDNAAAKKLITKNDAKILNAINEATGKTYDRIYIPNIQKVGDVSFDSNKTIKQKEGYLIATDINTKEKHKVVRQQNGSYEFYQDNKSVIKKENSQNDKEKGSSKAKF